MSVVRKYRVWIALVLVVLMAWGVSSFDEEADQKDAGKASRTTANGRKLTNKTALAQRDPAAALANALALIANGFAPREAMNKLRRDPFTVVSFEPPPPPPPPPPKPMAPPLNFKYLGVLREDEGENKKESKDERKERAVFLDYGGQLLIARKGDTLAGQYRVLEISDTSMQLEYTPLAERQTLNFGR
ncbi:MAG: hypothetical protein JWL63_2749 [Rhodocyclales bacterium]|nr:hypothetical protein [Rhodocyclales bacterium]